jgi:hypothetical protein
MPIDASNFRAVGMWDMCDADRRIVRPSEGFSGSMLMLVVAVRLSVVSVVSLMWAVLVTERAVVIAVLVLGLLRRGWERSGNEAVVRGVYEAVVRFDWARLVRLAGKFAVLRVETTMVLLLLW